MSATQHGPRSRQATWVGPTPAGSRATRRRVGVVQLEHALADGDDRDASPAIQRSGRGRAGDHTFVSVADRGHRRRPGRVPRPASAAARPRAAARARSATRSRPARPARRASERLRRRRMAAASHARAPAFGWRTSFRESSSSLPRRPCGRHAHPPRPRRAGDRDAALRHGVGPASDPLAAVSMAVAAVAVALAPRLDRRGRSPGVVRRRVLALALCSAWRSNRRARGHARVGRDLRRAARRLVRGGQRVPARAAGALLRHALLPRPLRRARPVAAGNVAGHPPGAAARLHALGITTAAGAAALCIGAGALCAPLTYPSVGRWATSATPASRGALRAVARRRALRRDVLRRRLRTSAWLAARAARRRAARRAGGRRGGLRGGLTVLGAARGRRLGRDRRLAARGPARGARLAAACARGMLA